MFLTQSLSLNTLVFYQVALHKAFYQTLGRQCYLTHSIAQFNLPFPFQCKTNNQPKHIVINNSLISNIYQKFHLIRIVPNLGFKPSRKFKIFRLEWGELIEFLPWNVIEEGKKGFEGRIWGLRERKVEP